MKVNINKESVLQRFLVPVSKISDECSINISGKNIFTLVNDQNGSTILFSKVKSETGLPDDATLKLNVKDIRKLMKVFECISEDVFELEVDDNCSQIKYKSPTLSFKMHLVTDSVIKKVSISLDKINKLVFNSEFMLTQDKISEILKGSIFATDSNKIYYFTKDGKVHAELTDKATEGLDSITYCVCDTFTGEEIGTPLPFSLEFLRIVSTLKTGEVKVKINNTYKIIMFEAQGENSTLKYIISSYTK